MADHGTPLEMASLRKWLHDLNNDVGVILAAAELLELERLSVQAMHRRKTIEDKALEIREILRAISDHYLQQ